MAITTVNDAAPAVVSKPTVEQEPPPRWAMAVLTVGVTVPLVALIAAVPVAWGWGLSWLDIAIALTFYLVTGFGVAVGLHRYFTHGAFKAKRWLRITLAVAGSLAIEGPLITWVADHRRHHAYADREGDPHSPWRYGNTITGIAKGLLFAHIGWMFRLETSKRDRFAPDLLADRDIRLIDRFSGPISLASVLAPPLIGGLLTWSWLGALTAFFWGTLVRIALLHHVTWSINSICHVYGQRPFATRGADRAANFWPLAIISFGESWHNSHHADPTCARHGVLAHQLDPAARVIWLLEKARWVNDVRWPVEQRLQARHGARQEQHPSTAIRKTGTAQRE